MDNTDIRSRMTVVSQTECFQDPRVVYRSEGVAFYERLDRFRVNYPVIISGTACGLGWVEGMKGTITYMEDVFIEEGGETPKEICNTEHGFLRIETESSNGKTREVRFNYICIKSIEEDKEV